MASVTVQALKAGEPYGRARVRAELTDLNGTAVAGYVDGVIVAPLTLTASGSGVAVFELVPNDLISPANTYYTISVDAYTFLIDVPDGGGNMEDLVVADSTPLGSFAVYQEFLADAQTPYFVSADDKNFTSGTASAMTWIMSADQLNGPGPLPTAPLPALAAPFVGDGTVTDPIGYNESAPFYTGPGAFKTLKTGVIMLQWAAQFEQDVGVDANDCNCVFELYCEDGTNQQQRIDNAIYTRGATGQSAGFALKSQYGGMVMLTVLDFDLLDENPYSIPSYPSFPNLYGMQAGVIPLGWDVWPSISLLHRTVDISGVEMEHFGMQITKIA